MSRGLSTSCCASFGHQLAFAGAASWLPCFAVGPRPADERSVAETRAGQRTEQQLVEQTSAGCLGTDCCVAFGASARTIDSPTPQSRSYRSSCSAWRPTGLAVASIGSASLLARRCEVQETRYSRANVEPTVDGATTRCCK
jgi:hypothetical protein